MTSPIPHNPEAEKSVLGAVLIDPPRLQDLTFLRPDDFYIIRHKWIWEAFLELYSSSAQIDLLTVENALERTGKLNESGGGAYLTHLAGQCPSSLHAESYAKMVHADGVRRRMIAAASQIATLAYDEKKDIEDCVTESDEIITEASSTLSLGKEQSFGEVLSEYYDVVAERSSNPDRVVGYHTGLIDIDNRFNGIQSKYYLIAGRPGHNKSSLMLNFMLAFAKQKSKTLYVSMEQPKDELANLLVSIESGIDNDRTITGRMTDLEYPKFTQTIETLDALKEYIILECRAGTLPTIQARIDKTEPDIVILDSLTFLRGHENSGKPYERINALSRDIKLLQNRIQKPILVVAHMNRAIEAVSRDPVLSDISEGGEASADVVWFIRKPENELPNVDMTERDLFCVKHRGGKTGKVTLSMKSSCTKFFSMTTRDLNEPYTDK